MTTTKLEELENGGRKMSQFENDVRNVVLISRGAVLGIPTDRAIPMLFDLFEIYGRDVVKIEYFKQVSEMPKID